MNKRTTLLTTLMTTTLLAAPAWAEPTRYLVDDAHTFARFSYDHLGFSTQLSRIDNVSGHVDWDPAAGTAQVSIDLDMNSVSTGDETFDEHIRGDEFLDTKRFPTASFRSTRVIFEDDVPVEIHGDLTIRGVTKPVTLTVNHFHQGMHPLAEREAIGANATTVISRSAFEAGKYVPVVGDEVTIDVSFEALVPADEQ
ncbi:MAG: YceI family protein [Halothiobacillaceae bacterium]